MKDGVDGTQPMQGDSLFSSQTMFEMLKEEDQYAFMNTDLDSDAGNTSKDA